jgi:hypothetical protein
MLTSILRALVKELNKVKNIGTSILYFLKVYCPPNQIQLVVKQKQKIKKNTIFNTKLALFSIFNREPLPQKH